MEIEAMQQSPSDDASKDAELFQSVCREFGSRPIIKLLVKSFGEAKTAQVLEDLGAAVALSGLALIKIYTNND